MGIGKPAKILNEHQLPAPLLWLETRKHALLSFKAGLRTKVIAWLDIVDGHGSVMDKVGARSSPFELLSPGMVLYVGTLVPTSDQVSDRLSRIMH
jgi:hypothetical protein